MRPISPLYLPYISPISPLYLPCQNLESIPGSLEMRPVAGHPDCPEGLDLRPYDNPSIP